MVIKKTFTIAACCLILLISLAESSYAKRYTKSQLLEMGGQTMSGEATKVGVYNFFVKTSSGEELNIHTDSGSIQFVPEDERLMVGDEITIIYMSHESASLSTDKNMAHYIEFTNKVPRNFLTDEMECVISLSGRNEKSCYLPAHQKTVSFEGNWPDVKYQGAHIATTTGSRILIQLKVVPANIGNGYVYKVAKIRPVNN